MERNSTDRGKQILKEEERVLDKSLCSNLPGELKWKILQRLPLKDAIMMFLVSRSWAEMIGSDYFSKAFLSQSVAKAKPRILFTSCPNKTKPSTTMHRWFHSVLQEKRGQNEFFLPRLVSDSCQSISQTVLGLVCCHTNGNSVIYNPGDGTSRVLPKVDISEVDEAKFFLGFDQKRQLFKVLCVVTGPSRMESQVLSLLDANNSWRKIDCKIPHKPRTRGLCLDGKVYYGAVSMMREDILMCFSLKNEEYSIISVPEEAKSEFKYNALVKLNDKLTLVRNYPSSIWILESRTWSKLPFDISLFSKLSGMFVYYCIGTTCSDQFIFAPRYVIKGGLHVIYYDIHIQRLERIQIVGDFPELGAYVDAFLDDIQNPTLSSIQTALKVVSNMTPM